jgi:hypothetical protein
MIPREVLAAALGLVVGFAVVWSLLSRQPARRNPPPGPADGEGGHDEPPEKPPAAAR